MGSFIMIEGFQFVELEGMARHRALTWLDRELLEFEDVDDDGKVVQQFVYISELEPQDIQDHCFMNGYIFNNDGRPIHHLILTEYKTNKESEA
jgi:hypothetical protein